MAKNTGYGSKAVKVMELLNKDPSYANEYVAAKAGCHPTYVKQLRKKMAHAQELEQEYLYTMSQGKQKRKEKPTHQFIEISEEVTRELSALLNGKVEPVGTSEIDDILNERGSRYGDFMGHARITQKLKSIAHQFAGERGKTFDADQAEALDMIFHKIGRILNGDPNYVDSWTDIAGYAKLVADRLQGVAR